MESGSSSRPLCFVNPFFKLMAEDGRVNSAKLEISELEIVGIVAEI